MQAESTIRHSEITPRDPIAAVAQLRLTERDPKAQLPGNEITQTRCLSAVIPCFNELATIERVVQQVLESPFIAQVILIDDASTDGTKELVQQFKHPLLEVIHQPTNRGKGAALRCGFDKVGSPYVIIQDADLECDPSEFPKLLKPLIEGYADAVYGSRFTGVGARHAVSFWNTLANRLLTGFSNILNNISLTDMETCYKVFRREVIQSLKLQEDRFGFEPEITAKLAGSGVRIYEVGISYYARRRADGKKIGWKDGFRALYCIAKYSPYFNGATRRLRDPKHENLAN